MSKNKQKQRKEKSILLQKNNLSSDIKNPPDYSMIHGDSVEKSESEANFKESRCGLNLNSQNESCNEDISDTNETNPISCNDSEMRSEDTTESTDNLSNVDVSVSEATDDATQVDAEKCQISIERIPCDTEKEGSMNSSNVSIHFAVNSKPSTVMIHSETTLDLLSRGYGLI